MCSGTPRPAEKAPPALCRAQLGAVVAVHTVRHSGGSRRHPSGSHSRLCSSPHANGAGPSGTGACSGFHLRQPQHRAVRIVHGHPAADCLLHIAGVLPPRIGSQPAGARLLGCPGIHEPAGHHTGQRLLRTDNHGQTFGNDSLMLRHAHAACIHSGPEPHGEPLCE